MHFTKSKRELASNCLLLEEILTGRTKLRRAQQGTTCHHFSFTALESLHAQLLRTRNPDRPQEPSALQYVESTERTTNSMVSTHLGIRLQDHV